jgi:hypothetical protein
MRVKKVKVWQVQDNIYRLMGDNLQLTEQQVLEYDAKHGNRNLNFVGGQISDVIIVHSKIGEND